MKPRMKSLLITGLLLALPYEAIAQDSGGGGGGGSVGVGADQIIVGGSLFMFGDESTQGGKERPGGTSTFVSFSGSYAAPRYFSGIGLFYNRDSQGESQTATAVGLKLELFYAPWYFEYGIGMADQVFTNRSIESRSGSISYMGFGVRVDLFSWLFFDGSFKQREYKFTKEDGIGMPDPIERTEFMPFLGLGTSIPL